MIFLMILATLLWGFGMFLLGLWAGQNIERICQ